MVFGGLYSSLNPSCSSMAGTSSGTRPSAALSWLPVSAATREVLSGMERMMTVFILGPPKPSLAGRSAAHQSLKASTRTWEFLSQLSNVYGPLPTGFCQKPSTSFFMALGEAMAKGDMVRFLRNGPWGSLSVKRTVVSSTASTLSMMESSSKPPNWAL